MCNNIIASLVFKSSNDYTYCCVEQSAELKLISSVICKLLD